MSGISTKGVKKTQFISKELKPGNITAKVNNLAIEKIKTPKDPSRPEFKIFLFLEGKPVGGDFVGFDKEFGNPAKGQYLGQTKKISYSNWPIRAYSYKNNKGEEIHKSAEQQILDFLQRLLESVGKPNWLEDNDGKFNTWEELFAGVIRSGSLKDKYLSWCVGATESKNAKDYTIYYMWLPEWKVCPVPFAPEGELVTQFNVNLHIEKDKKATENAALNDGQDEDTDVDTTGVDETDVFNEEPLDNELFDLDDE